MFRIIKIFLIPFFRKMDPVTQQPKTEFGFGGSSNDGHIPGLEQLQHMKEVKVKQIRPGCLECKLKIFCF